MGLIDYTLTEDSERLYQVVLGYKAHYFESEKAAKHFLTGKIYRNWCKTRGFGVYSHEKS